MPLTKDKDHLNVYIERRKRRTFVGALSFNSDQETFQFQYDARYLKSPKAIPIGPDLSIFKKKHTSAKGKLFPSFADRIPSRSNPAYEEYCRSQGISIDETNHIILLGTIGRRGPSSFVFEPIFFNDFSIANVEIFKKQVGITLNEISTAFDINEQTLQRLVAKKSKDQNTLKRIQIYFEFPKVGLWELEQNGSKLSQPTYEKMKNYFESQIERPLQKTISSKEK